MAARPSGKSGKKTGKKTGKTSSGSGENRSPKATPSLMEVALTKLDHRDRTREQLRQLLTRKVAEQNAAAEDPSSSGEAGKLASQERVDEVLARLEASGVISDRRFAQHYARGARARGASQAKVQQMLGRRGVERKDVTEALGALADEGLDELTAAKSYVKRRRLAERYDLSDAKQRQKALASLARQGFSSGTALSALGSSEFDDAGVDSDSDGSDSNGADSDDV